jgi:hypothetical protein
MGDIPEDVRKVLEDLVAAAVRIERERCAKIVETQKIYEIGDRHMLAAAIRNPST